MGETIQDALRDYSNVLAQSGSSSLGGATGELASAEGTVLRIASHVEEGITVYSILLDSEPNRISTAVASLSAELPITAAGDRIQLEYRENGSYVSSLERFDNLAFTQAEGPGPAGKLQNRRRRSLPGKHRSSRKPPLRASRPPDPFNETLHGAVCPIRSGRIG